MHEHIPPTPKLLFPCWKVSSLYKKVIGAFYVKFENFCLLIILGMVLLAYRPYLQDNFDWEYIKVDMLLSKTKFNYSWCIFFWRQETKKISNIPLDRLKYV